ncbi:YadA-like family protein [Advenella sp. S44]|uniref:YadA-like family protein n=1 Tax=Advenella sp. S44 TaxID=1982755 RepID=UPI00129068FB|nr:YadA-like family protein [Advenella sp. S44]
MNSPGQWNLTKITAACFVAGMTATASPVNAQNVLGTIYTGVAGSIGSSQPSPNGNGVAIAAAAAQNLVDGCRPAEAPDVGSVSIGCSAKGAPSAIAMTDRRNPFDKHPARTENGAVAGTPATAVGAYSNAAGSSVALGAHANALDGLAVAIGPFARVETSSGIAIGPRSWSTGNTSLAVGRQTVATADFAQALGNVSAATGKASLAIGHSTIATGKRSIAIGSADPDSSASDFAGVYRPLTQTKATAIGAVAIGPSAVATADSSLALGESAKAERANSVALGSGSTAEAGASAIREATVGGMTYTGFSGVVTDENKVVSVGAAGAERQLKNVGAGEISATSTDGINGSQLHAVMTEVGKGWKLQANGDTASKVAPGDTVQFLDGRNIKVTRAGNDITVGTADDLTANSLTINNGGPVINGNGIAMGDKKITGVADGTDPKDAVNVKQLNAVNETANKGWNLQANGDTASKVAPGDKVQFLNGTNINVTRNGNDLTIATTPALTADSLTINNGGPVINANGIAMGNKKITGVADGTDPTDAVNVKQLNAMNQAVNKGWNLQANGDTASKVAAGDTVQFLDGKNIMITRAGNDITVGTADDLIADSLTISNGGPVINGEGINMNDKKLTNVARGTLSADSKDGVNGSQLFAVGDSTATALGGDSTFDPATGKVTAALKVGDQTFNNVNDALGDVATTANKGWNLQANGDTASKVAPGDTVQFADGKNIKITRAGNDITVGTADDLIADSLTINNGGPVINGEGINMNDKKLTNVAPGTLSADSKDGVNGSQLFTVGDSTAKALGGDSTFDPATGVVTPSLNVGDKKFTNVNEALGDVATTANKGWNLQANGDTASKVAPGDTVQFLDGKNIMITRAGNDITVGTADDLIADSLTISNGGPVINAEGINMNDKKLTNVAPGTLSADSKDGVNGSQLFAVGDSTAKALGGDSTFDPATGVVTPSLNVGDKKFTNVNDALGDLNTTLASTTAEASKGWNLQANGDTVSKVAPGDTVQFINGDNINVIRNGNDLTIATTPALIADSLTINNGGPVITGEGIDMKDKKLTNVAPGTLSADSKDGVNGSQLFVVGDSTAKALGGDSTFDPATGKVTAGIKVGDQVFDNVNSALGAINTNLGVVARGWEIADAKGVVGSVSSGSKVSFVAGNEHTNVTVKQDNDGSTVTVSAAASPIQYTSTNNANGTNVPNDNPFEKSNSVTLIGADPSAPVTVNNVANAELSADSLQAVNGQQLYGLGQSIASTIGGDTRFNPNTGTLETTFNVGGNTYNNVGDALSNIGDTASRGWQLQVDGDTSQNVAAGATVGLNHGNNIMLERSGNQITIATAPNVTFDSVNAGNVEGETISAKSYLGIVDGPRMTQAGIDAAGKPITNVQAGEIAEGSTDVINGGQIYNLAGKTAAAINNLQSNLDRVAKDANAGSATAGAMANLPQAYLPGKSMFALATARYSGQQGFAAGLSKVSDNGNWIIKGSVSGNTRGKTMVGAGIGYQW